MFDLKKARELMEARNLDGIIVSSPENFYYVSGYISPHSTKIGVTTAILPRSQDPAVVVMDWEAEKTREYTWIKDIRTFETWIHFEKEGESSSRSESKPEQFDPVQVISKTLAEKGIDRGKLGIELEAVPVTYYKKLRAAIPNVNFVDATDLLLEMRSIKSPEERSIFREGARITEEALSAAVKVAKEGATEMEVAEKFRSVAIAHHCWGFSHISISSGPNSATPHYPILISSTYALKRGDLLRFDVGIKIKGYITDMARTYVIGEPSEKQKKLYNALLQAQRKIVQSMKPGVKPSDLFKNGIKTVREAGFPQYTRGHLGHSIGLGPFAEEPPFISETEKRELRPGMIFSIEVPYYITDFGGMNVEDMVLVTEDGHEELTTLGRELTPVG